MNIENVRQQQSADRHNVRTHQSNPSQHQQVQYDEKLDQFDSERIKVMSGHHDGMTNIASTDLASDS